MKPSFALNFSDDSIGLLHRTSRGWLEVGNVALDEPDLAQALTYLRGSALGLDPRGITTKLVIPNSQIRYITLPAPGPDSASRRAQIKAGLEGRTPYAVDDLVFDWWGKGPTVQVAVVARETLAEAEAFAATNRLNPLSFVAIPEPGSFGAEPWFGASSMAATLLAAGEKVDRDQDPIQIVGRMPKDDAVVNPTAVIAETVAVEPPESAAKVAQAVVEATEPTSEAAPLPDAAPEAGASISEARISEALAPDVPTPAGTDVQASPTPDAPPPPARAEPAVTGVISDTIVDELPAPPGLPELPAQAVAVVQGATTPTPSDPTDDTVSAAIAPLAASAATTSPPPDDDPAARITPTAGAANPTMPTMRAMVADPRLAKKPVGAAQRPGAKAPVRAPETGPQARRAAALNGSGASQQRLTATPIGNAAPRAKVSIPEAEWPLERVTSAARGAQAKGDSARAGAMITAPGIPMPRDRKLTGALTATPEATVGTDKAGSVKGRTDAAPMSVFGARDGRQRGKPRYLGLILTLILLALMAAVATLSSYVIASLGDKTAPSAVAASADAVAAPEALTQTEAVPDPDVLAAEIATAPAATNDPDALAADVAATTNLPVTTDLPAADDEMLADMQDPADFADPAMSGVADATATAALAPAAAALGQTDLPAPSPEPVAQAEPPAPTVETATVAPPDTSGGASRNPTEDPQDEIFLAMIDPRLATSDAIALAAPATSTDPMPLAQLAPPPFGTVYQFDAEGRIIPTADGIITPEGVRLVAGRPAIVPPVRPAAPIASELPATLIPAAEPAFTDPALADARPRARPEGLVPEAIIPDDDAAVTIATNTRFSSLKPRARPAEVLARGEAALATAEAEETAAVQTASASLVGNADQSGGSPLAIAVSRKPAPRPQDFNRAIEAAVSVAAAASLVPDAPLLIPDAPVAEAPASDDPGVVEQDEPEVASAAPAIPTRASVAKQATFNRAINLSKTNLIGVYGTSSNRYAMVRQTNGRFVKVEVGDRVDGGRVAAISDRELRYVKNGQSLTLKMPKG